MDGIPTLDELLLPDDQELDLYKIDSDLPLDFDPILLFPEPLELVASTEKDPIPSPNEPVSSDIAPQIAAPRRKRRKDELDYLRIKAAELEQQLTRLQHQELEVQEEAPARDGASVWRHAARRQLEGKQRAQRENEKLRGLVQGQLSIVQNLEKLLRKRSALEESGAWANERKRVRVEYEAESAIFDRILTKLDAQYKEMEDVFSQNRHAQLKTDGEHVQVKPDGWNGMFMEFLSTKVVPFELHATAAQFWKCMAQPQLKLRDGHYSVGVLWLIDGSEDTLSAKMAFTMQHNKHQVVKEAWFAVKRYVEEDRVVFAWACETKVEGTMSAAQSMRHRDTGWTLVEHSPSHDDSENSLESTIIQTCVQVRTELPEVLPRSQEELMVLTDIVTSSFLENLDGIHQSVEDALIEEAMRSG
uniref:Uncharacterized protein n=1 Tax=Phytophthora ramorum TaxID=164328 RepID=H3GX54_PHYRM